MAYPWDNSYASRFRPRINTAGPGPMGVAPRRGTSEMMGRQGGGVIPDLRYMGPITTAGPPPGAPQPPRGNIFGMSSSPGSGMAPEAIPMPSTWNPGAYNASQNQGWAGYDPRIYGQLPPGVTPGMIPAGQNWGQFQTNNPNWAQDWNNVGSRDMQGLGGPGLLGSQFAQQPMDEIIGGGYVGPRYGRGDIGGFPDLTPPPFGSGVGQTAYDLGSFDLRQGGGGGGQFGGPGQPGDPLHTPYPYNEPYTLMGNAGFMPWAEGSMLNNWITQYNSPNNQQQAWSINPVQNQLRDLYGGIIPSAENYNQFINDSAGGINRSISDLYPFIANNLSFGNASGGNINMGIQQGLGMFNQGTQPSRDWAQALMSNNLNQGDPGFGAGLNIGQNYGLPGTNLGYQQMNQNYGQGQQQGGFGQQQQGRAGDLYNAIATGGVPLNQELFNMGRTAFNTLGQNVLPSERVTAGQAQMGAPGQALGQQANRLFGQQFTPQTQQVNQPGFFNDLLGRAFGAGQGLQTPTSNLDVSVQTPNVAGADNVYAPQIGGPQQIGSPDIQNQVGGQLSQLLQGAGLTPQYVNAARETFLKPQQQAISGRLNAMGGGVAQGSSGLIQDQLRQNERDFMNQLTLQGGNNLNQYLQQGQGLGAQQFGQSIQNQQMGQQAQQFNAANALQALLANQQTGLQGSMFNVGQTQNARQQTIANQLQQALANQQAGLTTQGLGINAGLTGLGLGGQLSQQDIARQQANQGAGLQGQGMGWNAGLEANRIGAGMLGQQAGIEAQLQQFNPELALRAALANQQNTYQTGIGNANNAFRQADLARAIAGDYYSQAQQTAAGQAGLGQGAFGNALNYGGQNTDLFNALSGQNMNAMQMANQFGRQPAEFQMQGINALLGNQGQLFDFANQQYQNQLAGINPQLQQQAQLFSMLQGNQGMANQYLQGQQGYQAGQQGMGADLLRQSLGGDYDIARQIIAAITARDVQGSSNQGGLTQALVRAIPQIIGMFV